MYALLASLIIAEEKTQKGSLDRFLTKAYKSNIANRRRAGAILVWGSKVLCVYENLSGNFSFPKGMKNVNETDLECVQRKLYREANVVLDDEIKVGRFNTSKVTYLVAEVDGSKFDLSSRDPYVDYAKWFTIEELIDSKTNLCLRQFLDAL